MKRPYVTLKFAQTLDGRIAARDESSRWISGPQGLKFAHKLRARSEAILVGIGSVLADNPSLTTRLVKGKNPTRIIIDGKLRIPLNARVVKNTRDARTIIVTTPKVAKTKIERLKKEGVEFIVLPSVRGNIDLRKIICIFYKQGIKRILVEGGSQVITSFLKTGLADKMVVIISPKILGKGIESVGDLGIGNIKGALKLKLESAKRLGEDIIYTAYIRR